MRTTSAYRCTGATATGAHKKRLPKEPFFGKRRARSDALAVLARAGIDLNFVTLRNENGHANFKASC